jgi:hypothetical protein
MPTAQLNVTAPVEETDRLPSTYSVEKLFFGAVVIFQFYGNGAENMKKTRRTAD